MAITVGTLSNSLRNTVHKRVINPAFDSLRANAPARWGGQGPGVDSIARQLEKDNWSPYVLNTNSYIEIYTDPNAMQKYKAGGYLQQMIGTATSKMVGWSHGLSDTLADAIEEFGAGMQENAKNLDSNGGYLSFKSFITKYPSLTVTNEYSSQNIFGKILNFAVQAGNSVGGLTPNLQFNIQIPEMWKNTTFGPLTIKTSINSHTLHMLPATPSLGMAIPQSKQEALVHGGNKNSYVNYKAINPKQINALHQEGGEDGVQETQQISEGFNVLNAAMVALMMASPRQAAVSLSRKFGGGADTILKSPAIVDMAINGILFPGMNINSVSVEFGDAFDENGYPLEIDVDWIFSFPLLPSRENFDNLRLNLQSLAASFSNDRKFGYSGGYKGKDAPQLRSHGLLVDTGK